MTNEEALHEISVMVFTDTDNCEMRISKECYRNIVNALEKQIPEKPLKSEREIRYCEVWKCPKCGFDGCGRVVHYCYICGQAVDWSDCTIEKGGEQK